VLGEVPFTLPGTFLPFTAFFLRTIQKTGVLEIPKRDKKKRICEYRTRSNEQGISNVEGPRILLTKNSMK
jgi:hypothetical protein